MEDFILKIIISEKVIPGQFKRTVLGVKQDRLRLFNKVKTFFFLNTFSSEIENLGKLKDWIKYRAFIDQSAMSATLQRAIHLYLIIHPLMNGLGIPDKFK